MLRPALFICLLSCLIACDVNNTKSTYTQNTPPDFGPNVVIFDPSMTSEEIQKKLDAIYQAQEQNQFGQQRYALLFKPGNYHNTLKLGFYTQALGLGSHPDDVQLIGDLHVDAKWRGGDATQNFWRSVENMAITPQDQWVTWAVSQAAPMRRTHIKGNMVLDDNGGWGSGGFIADSRVDKVIHSGIQQQWLSRNTDFGEWKSGNWNMVFVGVTNPPKLTHWPDTPYSIIANTPKHREKPYLTVSKTGQYQVIVPPLLSQSQGISWGQPSSASTTVPIQQFYIAHADKDDAKSLNYALQTGKHLLLTPGIYHLNQPLHITKPNTIILGLGLATLQSQQGASVIEVDDIDGVKLAGLLVDAGEDNSQELVQIGPHNSQQKHATNPTILHDIFIRVGGSHLARATLSLAINSHDVIGDNLWIWRADHGQGVGWTENTTQNGLIVNGERVTIYGLAVEHYHQFQTVWNGEQGQVYFYQSEAPYEVPSQDAWQHQGTNGFASYKIANHITEHTAIGLGIYCYFSDNPSVKLGSAIEAPEGTQIQLEDITTVSLGGVGEITHILNNRGNKVDNKSNVARLKSID